MAVPRSGVSPFRGALIIIWRQTLTAQILVVMRKERQDSKSTLFSYSNWLAGLWPVLLFCAAFGIYEPLKIGPDWLQSPVMVLSISALVPFVVLGSISPYAFVGERVRGTLEAQRKLVLALLLPLLLPVFWVGPLMPAAWKGLVVQMLPALATAHAFPILLGLLLALDGIFVVLAGTRFHRKLLLLE